MTDLIKLTGLWSNRTKDGREYFSGSLGQARILVFVNDHRNTDKDPSHVIFLAPKADRNQGGQPGQRSAGGDDPIF